MAVARHSWEGATVAFLPGPSLPGSRKGGTHFPRLCHHRVPRPAVCSGPICVYNSSPVLCIKVITSVSLALITTVPWVFQASHGGKEQMCLF